MMNDIEYLLSCLSEECSEVSQLVSKSLRFGLGSEYNGESNIDRLTAELNDVLAVVEMLDEIGVHLTIDPEKIAAKRAKVRMFMDSPSRFR